MSDLFGRGKAATRRRQWAMLYRAEVEAQLRALPRGDHALRTFIERRRQMRTAALYDGRKSQAKNAWRASYKSYQQALLNLARVRGLTEVEVPERYETLRAAIGSLAEGARKRGTEMVEVPRSVSRDGVPSDVLVALTAWAEELVPEPEPTWPSRSRV